MATVDNLTIFYFTGTGNSGKVAEWISQVADELKVPCESISIANIDRRNFSKLNLSSKPNSRFLFISPTHGFNYPPVMMHFIMRFPKGTNKIALLNTRGGLRIGKWVTPGLSGIAHPC